MRMGCADKKSARARYLLVAAMAGLMLFAAGCQSKKPYSDTPGTGNTSSGRLEQKGSAGPVGQRRGFTRQGGGAQTGQVQVNGFLWRAALDTVSFMPLSSADPYGGVIITDWYSPPETPAERFKVNVLVRGEGLRSDGIKVTVFRQGRQPDGLWVDTEVDNNTQIDMENIILSQARQLRNEAQNQPK